MEMATHVNSMKLWHITDGRALQADTVAEEQFVTYFLGCNL